MDEYRQKGDAGMRKAIFCAPSRVYFEHPRGKFSYSSMVDYFDKMGIGAIDMSFEGLDFSDSSLRSVLYAAARRAGERGISLPLCHLSFYMPDPKNRELMAEFQRELVRGIDAAALMGIKRAVTHPIAIYSKEISYGDWVRANMAFLTPVVEYAREKGVRILIENMPADKEASDNHLYGSCALNISALADKLSCGVCWDTGHANISGYRQSEQLATIGERLEALHIHDNDGLRDSHLLPFDGGVDWDDVATGLRCCDGSITISVEVTAWALDGDAKTREDFGQLILSRARRFAGLADLI